MRKVILLKLNVSNLKNWIFMRIIWILFSLKSGPYLIQFCLTWSLPSTFNKKWICVRLESSNQYVWDGLRKAAPVCDAMCKSQSLTRLSSNTRCIRSRWTSQSSVTPPPTAVGTKCLKVFIKIQKELKILKWKKT